MEQDFLLARKRWRRVFLLASEKWKEVYYFSGSGRELFATLSWTMKYPITRESLNIHWNVANQTLMLTEYPGDINEICIIPWAEGSRNRTEKIAYESGTSASWVVVLTIYNSIALSF